MKPLLSAPEQVIKENTVLVEKAIKYYEDQNWESLSKIPVMIDQDGKTISYFGDDYWDVTPYVDIRIVTKRKATFLHLSSNQLKQEQKLLAFLGLFSVGSLRKGAVIKTTTFLARNMDLTQVYKYLESINADSICSLNHPIQYTRYCEYLKTLKMSASYISKLFFALSWVEAISEETPIKLTIPKQMSIVKLGRQLSCPTKVEAEQFYAIPSRLMQKIYSKALEYIENYYPLSSKLLDIHTELQENFNIGKAIVDKKIQSKQWNWLTSESPHYRVEVAKAKPQKPTEIIQSYIVEHLDKKYIPNKNRDFEWLYTHLLTCCF